MDCKYSPDTYQRRREGYKKDQEEELQQSDGAESVLARLMQSHIPSGSTVSDLVGRGSSHPHEWWPPFQEAKAGGSLLAASTSFP